MAWDRIVWDRIIRIVLLRGITVGSHRVDCLVKSHHADFIA